MPSAVSRLAGAERRVVEAFARELRERLGPAVARIVLFGSRARGDGDEESDYDVMVLLKEPTAASRQAVRDVAIDVSSRHGATLVALVYGEHEFTEDRLFYLYHEVVRDGVDL